MRGEPYSHFAEEKAENGTIWPLVPRTYHLLMSSGSIRNGASACTYTFFTRPRSMKSLTYEPPSAVLSVLLMVVMLTPSALAFS